MDRVTAGDNASLVAPPVVRRRRPASRYLVPLVPLLVVIPTWHFIVVWFQVQAVLFPDPFAVAASFYSGVMSGYDKTGFWYHSVTTLTEATVGLVIGVALGVGCGILLGLSRLLERSLYPYIIAFQGLPKIALAPVFIVWFGFGMVSKVALVVLVTFFPLLVNTWAGIRAANSEMINMARSFHASRWQVLRHIVLPGALPYIFAGLEIAVMYSIVGAIVSEFVGAQRGLGFLI